MVCKRAHARLRRAMAPFPRGVLRQMELPPRGHGGPDMAHHSKCRGRLCPPYGAAFIRRTCCELANDFSLQQRHARHLGRLRQIHQLEQGRRDVGEAAFPASARLRRRAARTGTGLVVWAVCGPPVSGSRISSQLPWSAVTEQRAAGSCDRLGDAAEAGIDGLHRLDGGRQAAGVADHVGIGVVQHDQVVFAGLDRRRPPCRSVRAPTSRAAGRRSRPWATAP